MISNCGVDEKGGFRGGKAGDQTQGEWCLRKFYSHPWDVMIRYPAAKVRHWIGDQARAAALNDCIGYDQSQRLTFWEQLKRENYDVKRIGVNCEADCSSGVLAICKAAGYHFGIKALQAIDEKGYTGNEKAILKKAGFEVYTDSKYRKSADYLDNGDILLNETRHTAINVDAGPKCDASVEPGGKIVQKMGVDVSQWQGTIDWERAKKGIDFAIIRCGYGANIASQDDHQWLRNVTECERLGIPWGAYLYSYAGNDEGAKSEADHMIRLLSGHSPNLPVFFDAEEPGTQRVSKKLAQIFIDRVRRAGYLCGIYASRNWYNTYLQGIDADCTWIADYGTNSGQPQTKPNVGVEVDIWQYSSVGKVSGISGNVDVNLLYDELNVPKNDVGIRYQAHCQTYGWMSQVHDGMTAGTTGKAKRLEALRIDPPKGVVLNVEVHCQKYGWKSYEVSHGSTKALGTVGESKRLEAVRIRCLKNPTGKKLKYQAHVQGVGWQVVASEGQLAGTTGASKRMEAIRIWFE